MELAERIGLSVFKDKDVNSGRPILDDDEQILHEFKSVKLILSVNDDQGAGTLYITDSLVIWLSESTDIGYSISFPVISMHAVSTDPESFTSPCLYVQTDPDECDNVLGGDEDEEFVAPPEFRFIPDNSGDLDEIFRAFCEGAERNPGSEIDDGQENGFFYNRDEVETGVLAHDMNDLLGDDPDRFAD